ITYFFFFFIATATTVLHTLSLHDALPISDNQRPSFRCEFNPAHPAVVRMALARNEPFFNEPVDGHTDGPRREPDLGANRIDRKRSEEHTSELQSLRHLVCRLLLEKKNYKQ